MFDPTAPAEKKGYAMIRNGMLLIWPYLQNRHRLMLPALLMHMGDGSGYPSQSRIAKMSGLSRRYVNTCLRELHRLGVVHKQRRKSKRHLGDDNCLYTLIDLSDDEVRNAVIERCKLPLHTLPEPEIEEADANLAIDPCGDDCSDIDFAALRVKQASAITPPDFLPPENTAFLPPENSSVPTPCEQRSSHNKNIQKNIGKNKEYPPAATHAGASVCLSQESEAARPTLGVTSLCVPEVRPTNASVTQGPASEAPVIQHGVSPSPSGLDTGCGNASMEQTYAFPSVPQQGPAWQPMNVIELPINEAIPDPKREPHEQAVDSADEFAWLLASDTLNANERRAVQLRYAAASDELSHTINAGPVIIDQTTFAEGTLKLSPITATKVSELVETEGVTQKFTYYKKTYNLKARRDGWLDKPIDTGLNERVGDLAIGFKLKPIVDVTNAPVKKPWPLNGGGKKQSGDPTVPPVALEFKPYKPAAWSFPWNNAQAWAA